MKIKNKEIKNSTLAKPKKNVSAILVLGIAAILIAGGLFFALSKMFETETYYILNQNVAAKTSINKSMLMPVETAKGTAPQNSISMSDIQKGTVYAKYPLNQGDVISSSNVGPIVSNYDGVPDEWVVTSFKTKSINSVDGTLTKGDYFDIIKDGRYIATDALILDVSNTSGPVETDETQKNSDSYRAYTVGFPQEIAPLILSTVAGGNEDQVHLVRSPIAARYEKRELEHMNRYDSKSKSFEESPSSDSVFELMDGTDPTFAPIVRDKNSRPVNEDNCKSDKIEPAKLCKINGFK